MNRPISSGYRRAYEAVNYRLRTFNGGRWADHCRPTSIIFLLSERCNARCVHCDIWKNRGQEHSPSVDQWKKVVSDLRAWLGPVQVTFSGGEALLIQTAPELIAHASSLGLFVEHLTHGYWADQTRVEQLARSKPSRVTISLDGIGDTHSKIRGRENFFEKTYQSIQTLKRIRSEEKASYMIRLKTVIMSYNVHEVTEIARFAAREGAEVFYQPIEQNYNTAEDTRWFEHSPTWPADTDKVIAAVVELIRLKREGLPVANSYEQLEAMIPYFKDPDSMRLAVQSHTAHESRPVCNATTTLQLQSNGDVTICSGLKPVGNIKMMPIREIWENRPRAWQEGCCMERRCTDHEKMKLALPVID